MKKRQWYNPIQMINQLFIAGTIQDKVPRIAMLIEICNMIGTDNIANLRIIVEELERTWYKISPVVPNRLIKLQRSATVAPYPDIALNFYCGGCTLPTRDPLFTSTHLGAVNESASRSLNRFLSNMYLFNLIPKQNNNIIKIGNRNGSLAKVLTNLCNEFSCDFSYNSSEQLYLQGLARHALMTSDFGFCYTLLKRIEEAHKGSLTQPLAVLSQLSFHALDTTTKIFNSIKGGGDPAKITWLHRQKKNLSQKLRTDRELKYSNSGGLLIRGRFAMMVEAGLLETTEKRNWTFVGFDKAVDYFDSVFDAIIKLSKDERYEPMRGVFLRDPSQIISLAWNTSLNEIEPYRSNVKEEDYTKFIDAALQDISKTGIIRIPLFEFFSLLHILNPNYYFHPLGVRDILLRHKEFTGNIQCREEKNRGIPILRLTRRRPQR
jgi:hypothetical protein